MCYVIKEMKNQVAKPLPGHNVLLAAHLAIPAHYGGSAIQTVLFLAFRGVAQTKFLLKINTSLVIKKWSIIRRLVRMQPFLIDIRLRNIQISSCFSLLNNSIIF